MIDRPRPGRLLCSLRPTPGRRHYPPVVTSWTRPIGFLLVLVLVASVAVLTVGWIQDESATPDPHLLPDMTMSPPRDLEITEHEEGGHALRFTSIMNNLGQSSFVMTGNRADTTTDEWSLSQVVEGAEPESRTVEGTLIWGGDGHDHWHLVGAASYVLESAEGSSGDEARGDDKVGFCIFDGWIVEPKVPEASDAPTFAEPGCGREESLEITMGLAVGWSDPYPSFLFGQSIDITGLPDGRYRLTASVDPGELLVEADPGNNTAWTEFDLAVTDTETPQLTLVGTSADQE